MERAHEEYEAREWRRKYQQNETVKKRKTGKVSKWKRWPKQLMNRRSSRAEVVALLAHTNTAREWEHNRRKAWNVSFVVVCFYFKRKQTNSIGFRSFVCSIFQLLSFSCWRCYCCCFLIGNKLSAERILNFNKYVHFDSFTSTRIVCPFVFFLYIFFSFSFSCRFLSFSHSVQSNYYARSQPLSKKQ